jgi:hypothetical protein
MRCKSTYHCILGMHSSNLHTLPLARKAIFDPMLLQSAPHPHEVTYRLLSWFRASVPSLLATAFSSSSYLPSSLACHYEGYCSCIPNRRECESVPVKMGFVYIAAGMAENQSEDNMVMRLTSGRKTWPMSDKVSAMKVEWWSTSSIANSLQIMSA